MRWSGKAQTGRPRAQIDIDRDAGTFHASGNVVSELQDQKKPAIQAHRPIRRRPARRMRSPMRKSAAGEQRR